MHGQELMQKNHPYIVQVGPTKNMKTQVSISLDAFYFKVQGYFHVKITSIKKKWGNLSQLERNCNVMLNCNYQETGIDGRRGTCNHGNPTMIYLLGNRGPIIYADALPAAPSFVFTSPRYYSVTLSVSVHNVAFYPPSRRMHAHYIDVTG